jgi:exopolysaccharide biosynthesis WecB/TagA/CpsF family protein
VKILVVHNSYQQPGGEDVVFEQERQLLERAGHRVLAYRRSNLEMDQYRGLKRLSLLPKTVWAADTREEFVTLLRQEKPQLVHVHNTLVLISPSIYSACLEARVPVVQTLHNYRLFCPAATFFRDGAICEECVEHSLWHGVHHGCYRSSRSATAAVALMLAVHRRRRTWSREVGGYIALTQFARSKFVEAGLPAEKIFVKPNFVYPDPGTRVGDGDYALFVGRLSPKERVSTMLAAWSRLPSCIPLLIVGGGLERTQLEAEAVRRNLAAIRFLGQLPRDKAVAAIRGARFLVFPSEWYENFPVTIAESFACGVPVICSRLGAMQEIVDDGRTGLHFTAGDAEDLAQKVAWAWNHPELMREMGKEARQAYESQYTAEKNYPILMKIYEQTIRSVRGEPRKLPDAENSAAKDDRCREANHLLPSPNLQSSHLHSPLTFEPAKRASGFTALGVRVDAIQIPEVITQMTYWIEHRGAGHYIAVTGMHGVMEARQDSHFKTVLNEADLVVPDGMPLVWLARRHGHALARRVYGPELMETFCCNTKAHFKHFFYGGAPGVPEHLAQTLHGRHGIRVAGTYSPPFRPLTREEDEGIAALIEAAAPDVLWVGLSTPKQEYWMYEHRDRLKVPVILGVGAAFDFTTGRVKQAPSWMQEHGLEWLFRLVHEPRRLWRRYLIYGSRFAWNVSLELLSIRNFK